MTRDGTRLYLVGFMGAGKTTVAGVLAEKTGWPRVELDAKIEVLAGRSIPEIFDSEGEAGFRELETRALRRVAGREPPLVVSCGGGLPLRKENRELLEKTGFPVYLHVDPEAAWKRVGNDPGRPLAREKSRFKELMRERTPIYEKISSRVDTTGRTPEEVASEVLSLLEGFVPGGLD